MFSQQNHQIPNESVGGGNFGMRKNTEDPTANKIVIRNMGGKAEIQGTQFITQRPGIMSGSVLGDQQYMGDYTNTKGGDSFSNN